MVVVLSLQQWTVRMCLLIPPVLRVLVLAYRRVWVCQAGRLSCSADEMTASKDLCGVYKKAKKNFMENKFFYVMVDHVLQDFTRST